MSNKFDNIIDKFIEKYGKVIRATPDNITDFLIKNNKKFYKKALDYDKYFDKNKNGNEIILFKNLINMFGDYFYKGENEVTLKKEALIGPVIANIKNETKLISITLENKKIKINDTYIFAFYNNSKNTFMWAYPDDTSFICKNSIFNDHSFCKVNMIKGVNPSEASILGLWFRLMVYLERNIKNSSFLENFKTTNLVLFDVELNKNKYTIFTLMDYGIKDPKFDLKFSTKINMINQLVNTSKTKTSMKGIKVYKGKSINKLKL